MKWHAERVASVDRKRKNNIRPTLSREAAQSIVDQYAESNADVARRYLNRPDGKLFYENKIKVLPQVESSERITLLEVLKHRSLI